MVEKISCCGKALALIVAGAFALAASPLTAQNRMPTVEELWSIIQQQQQQINELQRQAGATQAPAPPTAEVQTLKKQVESLEQRADEAEKNLEAAATVIEENAQELAQGGALDSTTIGGYGELHYNGGDTDEIDFHRFVLFFGHRFNDWITFASEFELEHALTSGDGTSSGEVELEQAYIDFALSEDTNAKAGVILMPVGILNDTHEPNTFFGTERNNVEKNIIPTTWWEAGGMLSNRWDHGISTDLFLSSGLEVPTTGSSAYKPRSGRGKISNQTARDPAFTGRVKWSGMPGMTLSAAVQYQADVTQSANDNSAWLTNVNMDILKNGWGLRGLYARWDIGGGGAAAAGRDVQYGWYIEPSYRFDVGKYGELGIFGRYSDYDNEAGNSTNTNITQFDFGLNYWPHPQVVIKADYQIEDQALETSGKTGEERLNLGLGYQF